MSKVTEHGLYRPGSTALHRLDPRLKVVACLLLVTLAFAAAGWAQLLILALVVWLAATMLPQAFATLWKICWMLRWLFLFTLLMHLFFTPGRTLLGTSWLSLDGLQSGCFVTAQMLLALCASALLAITTSTVTLAAAFGWFVKPLQSFGCRTLEWQQILLLAMDFVPLVQEEMRVSGRSEKKPVAALPKSFGARWSLWMDALNDFLLRLVNRGDTIARRLASEDEAARLPVALPTLLPLTLLDQLFALTITLVILCYWFT